MLSDRQILFRNYLVKKLGFVDDDFLKKYLEQLEISAVKFKYLGALPAVYEYVENDNGELEKRLKDGDRFKVYQEKHGLFVPKNYNILDFLNKEVKTKQTRSVTQKRGDNSFISATDISNFTYCPVSFAISKTFDLIKIESAFVGTDLHEEKRLINLLSNKTARKKDLTQETKPNFINEKNQFFFDEVYSSKIIYNGHNNENEKKYFKSSKGNFVGQPDYIFQNLKREYFTVEEKFQFENTSINQNEKRKFHNNHINQLISYLHGINDYDIKYGFLIYWKFDFDWDGNPFVHSCYVLKIIKDETTRNRIIEVYTNLKTFIDKKVLHFNINSRSANKCANCVSSLICGHKTGKFDTLQYPYSSNYLNIHSIKFPDELKKENNSENQNGI